MQIKPDQNSSPIRRQHTQYKLDGPVPNTHLEELRASRNPLYHGVLNRNSRAFLRKGDEGSHQRLRLDEIETNEEVRVVKKQVRVSQKAGKGRKKKQSNDRSHRRSDKEPSLSGDSHDGPTNKDNNNSMTPVKSNTRSPNTASVDLGQTFKDSTPCTL